MRRRPPGELGTSWVWGVIAGVLLGVGLSITLVAFATLGGLFLLALLWIAALWSLVVRGVSREWPRRLPTRVSG